MDREIELMIIRAVNFYDMNSDRIKKMAIEKTKTVGEIYIELKKDNFVDFFKNKE